MRLIGFVMAIVFCVIGKIYEIRANKKLKKIEE